MGHDHWPPLPPFMSGCPACSLYVAGPRLTRAVEGVIADHDLLHGQLEFAAHIAARHPDDVPGPHSDCALCEYLGRVADAPQLARAHQAGSLFLPPNLARML